MTPFPNPLKHRPSAAIEYAQEIIMQVGIAYSEHAQQIWLTIEVPDEAKVSDAIARSSIL